MTAVEASLCNTIRVVNRIASAPEEFRPRWLTPHLRRAVVDHPVVVLTGARQVGKSTLLRHEEPFRSWRYHTLDDLDALAQVATAPEALWAGADRILLDGVQKAPALLSAVKRAVDRDRGLRFVLSGSANLLLMRQVSESLAGRAVYFVLDPRPAQRPAPQSVRARAPGPPLRLVHPRRPRGRLRRRTRPASPGRRGQAGGGSRVPDGGRAGGIPDRPPHSGRRPPALWRRQDRAPGGARGRRAVVADGRGRATEGRTATEVDDG